MLIEFSVSNFRSIQAKQTLSLVAGSGRELLTSNSFSTPALKMNRLLRSAAIYGPNAAGKSNLIDALGAMQRIVLNSAAERQRGDPLQLTPFRLDEDSEHSPTDFEVIFAAGGARYQYGFSATRERVLEEWLFAYPHGRPQRWIGRAWSETNQNYEWDKMGALSGQKQLWQDSTRSNALFLSTAVQLNSEQLQPVYDWFKTTLHLTNVRGWSPSFTASLCQSDTSRESVLSFLKVADLDIENVHVEVEKLSAKHLPDDMPEEIKAKVIADMKGRNIIFDIRTVHRNIQGKPVEFDFDDESDGTRKLFSFAGPWLDTLKNGYVLIIDELHDNLHPMLVNFLVRLFHSEETNPKNAQLVFTTHETSILNQDLFRRDQIWFCEKGEMQATRLFPLTDFSPRKGREDLEAAYLGGRYGALPYIRDLKLKKAG
jgi:AAA15 family ATPase/GTPase